MWFCLRLLTSLTRTVTMADSGHVRPPLRMNIHEPNLADSFKKWKRELEIYMIATEKTKKANATQVAIILNCAGPDFISIYDHFQWSSEGDKERPDKLLEKLEEYCAPKGNVVVNAYRFWNARWKEPFDAYLTELRTMAALCEYDNVDRMIRDKIVFSASGKLQELLLRDTNLTLGIAIDILQSFRNDAQAGERNEPGFNDWESQCQQDKARIPEEKNKVREQCSSWKQGNKGMRLLWLQTLAR